MAYSIDGLDLLKEEISGIDGVKAQSSRLLIVGMANSASKSQGVMINGINPDTEKKVFDLHDKRV